MSTTYNLDPDRLGRCSGGVSWFYRKILDRTASWEWCCDEHDVAYWENGGFKDKLKADWRFMKCLFDFRRPFKAVIFFLAVFTVGSIAWVNIHYQKKKQK